MFSAVQIVNIGLAKIASSSVSRIDPPQTALEKFVAANYEHWKRSEVSKRRWVFALESDYALSKVDTIDGASRPYKYSLPTDCLRPVRSTTDTWVQRRRFIYSADSALKITYIANVDETEFDPLFVEVMACRVALEACEFVTQSNTKKADAIALYDKAVLDAGRNNAYVIGAEDVAQDDTEFPFLTERY